MLEHAVRLDLVQRSLEKTLLIQVLVVVIGKRAKLLSLLVEELEIGSALVRDVAVNGFLDLLFIPLDFAIPVVLLVVVISIIIEGEIGLLGGILALWSIS